LKELSFQLNQSKFLPRSGIYEIDGSEELLQVAFDAGLGSKNSQGFGMIEKYEKQINISNVTSKENPFTKKGRYPS